MIVRTNLTPSQIAVQAVHAALSVARQNPIPEPEFVVLCAVHSEQQLLRWAYKLEQAGIVFCAFREPDLAASMTAIATEPVSGDRRRFFRSLQLFKESNHV